MSKVRVRFAPSPTGPLHIGGLRTALFNYLFAKKHEGTFILRIEDTDQARYVAEAEAYILESLKWCGIGPDEGVGAGGDLGPYRQSERKERYSAYADRLINSGDAYMAFDTPEELDQKRSAAEAQKQTFTYDANTRMEMKNSLTLSGDQVQQLIDAGTPYVVRFKFPADEVIVMQDIIRGEVHVESRTLDDKILFKSDGMPTYHLANVVDDHEMEITHVIRGEEWLPSLPLHVSLYKSFGWTDSMPQFAHLPLILKPDGKGKLSKRDGDKGGFPVFPLEWKDPKSGEIAPGYREEGYYPEACINILAFLGWNPGTEKELYSLEELTRDFDLEKVGKAGAKFDPDKARWFNHQYLQLAPTEELAASFEKILLEKGVQADPDMVQEVVLLVRELADFVSELWDQSSFFFQAPESYDEKVVKKRWKESTPDLMRALSDLLQRTEPFTAEKIENEVKAEIEAREWGMGAVMNTWRLLLVGAAQGPSLFHMAEILGKEEVLKRIETGINRLS
jgi:glutamyl-tRNA synthetase